MSNQLSKNLERIETLSEKEKMYFQIMWAKYGVLFITSEPGIAKSSIAKSIADKMGYDYVDMRLSMNDESDFKYPYLEDKIHNGVNIKVSNFAVPKWAYKANERPTIIHFEELNRAPLFVRNAALQILLEREIGDFKFNDNVLMLASGNLGEDDGTEVEELDSALNNRLIHINHKLSLDEWLDNFAYENCHSSVVSFIKAYPSKLYEKPNENTKAYATPRSWTMLSEFIIKNFGKNSTPNEFLPALINVANGYIGNASVKFIRYCQDSILISIKDVVDNYEKVKEELSKFNRDKISELLSSLKDMNLNNLNKKQLKNVISFLSDVSPDERVSYLIYLVDMPDFDISDKESNLRILLLNFKKDIKTMEALNESF